MGLVQLDTHVGLEINPALSCNLETIPTSILGLKLGLSILFVILQRLQTNWPVRNNTYILYLPCGDVELSSFYLDARDLKTTMCCLFVDRL